MGVIGLNNNHNSLANLVSILVAQLPLARYHQRQLETSNGGLTGIGKVGLTAFELK